MPGRNIARGRILGALIGLAVALGGMARAQDVLPERRLTVEAGVDFYGGDLRSIYGTTLPICRDACLATAQCGAFTFNTAAASCFLKTDATRRDPFPAARSAVLGPQPAGLVAAAAARQAELAFLAAPAFASAREAALSVGFDVAPIALDPDGLATLSALRAAVNSSDAARDWLALAAFGTQAAPDDWDARRALRETAVASAVNAYLRGGGAQAARALGAALEAQGEGRLALDALRLAERLAPGPQIAADVARAEALYGFRVLDLQVDFEPAAPRACVNFSEGLASAGVEYADFVSIDGGPFPVVARDGQLCIEGLSHGTRYAFTLRAGLPSAGGEVLPRSVAQEVYVRDRSPAVRFLGRAYVLPRSAEAAIPVSSVNVSDVALRVFRVGGRNVSAVIRNGDFGAAVNGFEERRLGDELGEAVWEGVGEIAPELNRDVVTALPVGDVVTGLAPGLYAMTARIEGRAAEDWESVATQWFVVTDLGLSTLKGSDGLHVFLRALWSAAPREGVEVSLIARNNDVLGRAVTDAAGYVRFDPGLLRGAGGAEAALVTAEADGDFAFLDLTEPGFDLSDRGVEGRPAPAPVDVFLTTDRGAYRPGETVFATILARDARGQAILGLPLTAIVSRPDGVEFGRYTLPDAGAGGRAFALALDPGSQRGGWRLAIHADVDAPALAAASFLVEEFTPERLDLVLDAPEGPVDPAAGVVIEARADYLFGAPGAGLAVEGEVTVALARDVPGFAGYLFGLEDEPYRSGYAPLPGGLITDGTGRIEAALSLPELGPVSRPLQMTATVRVADGSGRPVERSLTRSVLPEGPLIGVKPLFGDAVDEGGTAAFDVIAVGRDLAPEALAAVAWTLSKVETTFQWYEVEGAWNYEPISRRSQVANGSVDLGGAPVRIEAGVDWGRYELELAATDGRLVATSLGFDAGWYAAGPGGESPDFIEVSLDSAGYAVGDVARLRIEARNAGQVQVAVLGDRLIAVQTVEAAAGETVVALPVTEAWAPGAYVTATLIRPMDVAARRNPARAIGLAWAAVDPGARRLDVAFDVADEVSPRSVMPADLRIEGLAPGTTAYATIAAVDVGILNLTGFEAPDPDGHYFGQRRLGVEMRDVYGRLIDAMQGVPGRVRSGGDGGAGFRAPPPTEDLVAVFSGMLVADAEGRVSAPVALPDFNGTVRLMAVAWTAEGVGQAVTDVLVRDPVVVQAALPLFLAPGDRARMRLDLVHAFGPAGPVAVQVRASEPGLLSAGGVALSGEIAEGGRLGFSVPLTGGAVGDHRLTVETVAPGGERLVKELTVAVRANDPALARQDRIALAPGETLTLDGAVFDGLAPGTGHATLAVGSLADFDVPGLLTALEAYPFGCTEQIVSRALPLLYFAETAQALGLRAAEVRIGEAIRGVLANQTSTGGFGLWGVDGGDGWLDAYASDFLSRARASGHEIPDRAFDAAMANLTSRVNAYGDFENGGEDLAYALMVLARESRASIGDLRYYADTRAAEFATPLAQAQLGMALTQYGDQPRADAMFRLASEGARAGEAEQVFRADFGSGLRDAAGVLALGAEAGSSAVDASAMTAIVTAPGAALSPQEGAWSLLAAHALVAEAATGGVLIDGATVAGPGALRLEEPALRAAAVRVSNAGEAETLAVLTVFGAPDQPEPAQGNGYRITRELLTLDGAPVDPAAVALNERMVAVVTVTPERDVQARLIVVDPLAAGLEIDNPNLLRAGETGRLGWLDADDVASHVEFQAERFVAAVDWQGAQPFRLAYMVRAVSPGSFHRPAASVEDMYRPAYRARTGASRVEVLDAPR